jgi:hypothetical protein
VNAVAPGFVRLVANSATGNRNHPLSTA